MYHQAQLSRKNKIITFSDTKPHVNQDSDQSVKSDDPLELRNFLITDIYDCRKHRRFGVIISI